jgi:hypothetical protein
MIASAVWQCFMRQILPFLLSTQQRQNDIFRRNDAGQNHHYNFFITLCGRMTLRRLWCASAREIVRSRESTVETQPQLQPALLNSSITNFSLSPCAPHGYPPIHREKANSYPWLISQVRSTRRLAMAGSWNQSRSRQTYSSIAVSAGAQGSKARNRNESGGASGYASDGSIRMPNTSR